MAEERMSLMTAKEAARYLRVSMFTLSKIEREGGLIPYRTPGGHRRYSLRMLNEYLEESRTSSHGQESESQSQAAQILKEDYMQKKKVKQSKQKIEVIGMVTEALKGGRFKVELDNSHEVLAYVSGKIRRYYIRILLGDQVKVELSPYDLDRGRIVYRYKRPQFARQTT